MDIEILKNNLKNSLSEKRYMHSLLVAKEAEDLARHYNINEHDAYLAGLLHDIAKEFTSEENKQWIMRYDLDLSLLEEQNKKIVHADVGAVVVKELYNLKDDICNAIKYHTIGNIKMNDLAKIVFIADKIGREVITPEIENLKELAYQDLDLALLEFFKNSEEKFKSKGKSLHPKTLELITYLSS